MIGRIHGTLIAISAPKLLIDCHGVGYEVDVPMSTLYQLPAVGQLITLLTHFHDAQLPLQNQIIAVDLRVHESA